MSDECAICKERQHVAAFRDGGAEGVEGACYRLPCGHAFHTACLVPSLRFGNASCAVCRAVGNAAARATLRVELRNSGPVAHLIFDDDDEDSASASDLFSLHDAYMANPHVHAVRCTDARVIAANRRLRGALRDYHVWRDRLRAERRARLQEAMRAFRNTHYRTFRNHLTFIESAIEQVRTEESRALALRMPDAAAQPWWGAAWRMPARHLARETGERRHDPCNRGFWSY